MTVSSGDHVNHQASHENNAQNCENNWITGQLYLFMTERKYAI